MDRGLGGEAGAGRGVHRWQAYQRPPRTPACGLLRHANGLRAGAAAAGQGSKGVNEQRMDSNKSPACLGVLAGERQALALMLAGSGLAHALVVLLQAFEGASAADTGYAVHWPRSTGQEGLRAIAGPAWLRLGAEIDALPADQSPVARVAQSLQPVQVDDVPPDAAAADAPWPACRALMQAHGVRRCRMEPLLDAQRQPIGVLACYERGDANGDADTGELARAAVLLIEYDRRQRQRDHETQQRSETLRMLAHDMRNLLAPLRTALEVLSRPQADAQALERLRSIMSRQVAQLAALPDELSRLARSATDEPAQAQGQLRLPTDEPAAERAVPVPAPAAAPAPPLKPASPPPAAPAAPARRAAPLPDGAPRRVLVADDNEHVRESFVELLAAEGFEVRTAVDGEQAVEIADQWRPDVVLLDIHMPRLSGLETARRLRASHPPQRMTLLMLSGMSLNEAWVRHAKAAGFDDCLDKSADPRAWLARVRARAAH